MKIVQLVDFYFPSDAMSKLAKLMHSIDLTLDPNSLLVADMITSNPDVLTKNDIKVLYMRANNPFSLNSALRYFFQLQHKIESIKLYLKNRKRFDKHIGEKVDNADLRVWHNPQHFVTWWKVQKNDIIFWHNFTYPYLQDHTYAQVIASEIPRLKLYNDLNITWLMHSQFSLNSLRHYGIEPQKYAIIPYSHQYNLPYIEHSAQRPHLLAYSRYAPHKGYPEIVQLAKENKYALTTFGDNFTTTQYAKEYNKCKELASSEMRILGLQAEDAMEYIFNQANIYISNSRHEGLGYPIIEAYAHSLPVIVRGGTAMPELVIEGKTGFVFDDINEVPALIEKIMQNYKEMSYNAWKHSQNFTYEKFKERYLNVLKEYMKEKHK